MECEPPRSTTVSPSPPSPPCRCLAPEDSGMISSGCSAMVTLEPWWSFTLPLLLANALLLPVAPPPPPLAPVVCAASPGLLFEDQRWDLLILRPSARAWVLTGDTECAAVRCVRWRERRLRKSAASCCRNVLCLCLCWCVFVLVCVCVRRRTSTRTHTHTHTHAHTHTHKQASKQQQHTCGCLHSAIWTGSLWVTMGHSSPPQLLTVVLG